jgi:type I restriction enzyme M protein
VARGDIEAEGYDLSLSRYKEDVFEEVVYEAPGVILDRLLQAEVGEEFFNREIRERREKVLDGVQSGIVRELLELRGMVG